MVSEADLIYLSRCVELAREALEAGDDPFGSVLVDVSGKVVKEDRNRVVTEADVTLHPEFALAKWAQSHMSPTERARAIVYTSGEHCPMCTAAHAYAGLGRIVYATSSNQLQQWKKELGVKLGPVIPLPIHHVAPGLSIDGPAAGLSDEVRELHRLKQEQATSRPPGRIGNADPTV